MLYIDYYVCIICMYGHRGYISRTYFRFLFSHSTSSEKTDADEIEPSKAVEQRETTQV